MTLRSWTRRSREVALAPFQRGWRGVTTWIGRLIGGEIITPRRVDRWLDQSVRDVFGFVESRLAPITLVVIVVVVAFSIVFWDWLSFGESGSTTIRNLGLVVAAVVALPLAIWRSKVAERQAETAEQNLLNERYQKGAEMLGSDALTVRLGGIYGLQWLAQEHPEQYHVQIMQLFCAFARRPTKDDGIEARPGTQMQPRLLREDVQGVMAAISVCHRRQLILEPDVPFQLDLKFANLSRAWLVNENLPHANFMYADLSHSAFSNGSLSSAMLSDADLSHAWLDYAELSGADLSNTILSGTQFLGVVESIDRKA